MAFASLWLQFVLLNESSLAVRHHKLSHIPSTLPTVPFSPALPYQILRMNSLTLLLLSCLALAQGFSVNSSGSRRQMLEGASIALASNVLTPFVAKADITNKVASAGALRNVKRAQKQLDTLELYAVNDQYAELKQAVRNPPLSDIRKSCSSLIRGGEDGPDAEKLTTSYQKFVVAFEQMDNYAGLGVRGRKLNEGEVLGYYKGAVDALGDFLLVAEDSVTIPVQYEGQ
jgi:hypothetical protein